MPIRRHHRWLYPIDWRELSSSIRFRHDGGHCETCGRPHGRMVLHLGDGRWWDEEAGRWRDGAGKLVRRLRPPYSMLDHTHRTRVVLATAHRDHDPTNNEASITAALCQRCHILYDRKAPEVAAAHLSGVASAPRPVHGAIWVRDCQPAGHPRRSLHAPAFCPDNPVMNGLNLPDLW